MSGAKIIYRHGGYTIFSAYSLSEVEEHIKESGYTMDNVLRIEIYDRHGYLLK